MREILAQTLGALLGVLSAAAVIVLMAIVVTTVASANTLDSFSQPELVDIEIEIFVTALTSFQTDRLVSLGDDGQRGGQGKDSDIDTSLMGNLSVRQEGPDS